MLVGNFIAIACVIAFVWVVVQALVVERRDRHKPERRRARTPWWMP